MLKSHTTIPAPLPPALNRAGSGTLVKRQASTPDVVERIKDAKRYAIIPNTILTLVPLMVHHSPSPTLLTRKHMPRIEFERCTAGVPLRARGMCSSAARSLTSTANASRNSCSAVEPPFARRCAPPLSPDWAYCVNLEWGCCRGWQEQLVHSPTDRF